MTSQKGHRTPEEGAKTAALLATDKSLADVTGKFFSNEVEVEW